MEPLDCRAPSYPGRWLFGLFAACWGSHQPLFAGGAGQFLEHIRAEVFPDECILVEQSKAANLPPLRRFGEVTDRSYFFLNMMRRTVSVAIMLPGFCTL